MTRLAYVFLGAGACVASIPTYAQVAAPLATPRPEASGARPVEDDSDTIVVTGQRPEGSVIGDIAPEVTFDTRDIRSFGVSSLADLLTELAPQTGSNQGRGGEAPIVLLGGKRISGFSEIRDIPTEAIQRVEILPEEVALKYGYRPNQKVVNIVLRRRFRAFTGELEAGTPTGGGQFSPETDNSYLRIDNGKRLNLAFKYQHSSALYENERDITEDSPRQPYDFTGNVVTSTGVFGVPASAATRAPLLGEFSAGTANVSDTGRFRTLLPETNALTLNAVLARTIFDNVSASFNGRFTYNSSDSAQGPATAALGLPAGGPFSPFASPSTLYRYLGEFGALGQENRSLAGHFGTTLSGAVGRWNWSFTGSFDHSTSRTNTERGFDLTAAQGLLDARDPLFNPYAPLALAGGSLVDRARSASSVGDASLVVTGSLFTLPAGAVTTTVKLGSTTSDLNSRSTRSGFVATADLSRDSGSGQVSFDLPIASRKRDFLPVLGELSVSLNAAYERYSDFGGLRTLGAGVSWTPIKPVSLIASLSKDKGAPSIQQLGNPLISTTGVRVFDYIRGESVDITRLTGGNPNLTADDRRVIKLGLTLKPLAGSDLTLTANYTNRRINDPIASFPTATAAIEAAFPDRFSRDADGRLTQIDSRPINFAQQDQEDIRWGINFSKQLSTPPRPAAGREGEPPSLRDLVPGQPNPGGQPRRAGERGPGARGGPGGPGGFGRGPGGRGTRLQLALYYTLHLREEILVYDGGPKLDLLGGDAINSSGGQSRHEVEAQAGLTHDGFGARLSANWQSGTSVDGGTTGNGGANGGQSLNFSDLATFNLRLFANLGQQQALTKRYPFLRGTRVSLSANNLFDARLNVRDEAGITPVNYQPDFLDPLGRSVRISVRKLFF